MPASGRVFIADAQSLIGASLVRALARRGLGESVIDSTGLDLADGRSVEQFFDTHRPSQVILAAGKKGGIQHNQEFPADLMLDNLRVATNVLDAARRFRVEKLLYLGSACMYPRECPQPAQEAMLLSGPLEPTSEAYSLSKLAGLKLCLAIRRQYARTFIAAIPTNVFGPGDEFDPSKGHVVSALIQRIHAARETDQPDVVVWGTGKARREFLYCDDLADASLFLLEHYDSEQPINIASGADLSIRELAESIKMEFAYQGTLRFDSGRPDGAPRKALDSRLLTELGWRPTIPFREGLKQTCHWYEERLKSGVVGGGNSLPIQGEVVSQT